MDYYRKFDTVGLISLNDWYILDFQLKAYDENGNEIPNKTSSNMLFGNTGEITYSSHGDVSRGMAEIDITLPENYKLNKRNLTDHLCQSCLDKVAASLEYWKYENERKNQSRCVWSILKLLNFIPYRITTVRLLFGTIM